MANKSLTLTDLDAALGEVDQSAGRKIMPSAASMKIEASTLSDPRGSVIGAYSVSDPKELSPKDVFLLHEGDVLPVPAGTSVRVQDGSAWRTCEFLESGRLVGPLIWSAGAPVMLAEVVERTADDYRDTASGFLTLFAAMFLPFMVIKASFSLSHPPVGVAAFLVLVMVIGGSFAGTSMLSGEITIGRRLFPFIRPRASSLLEKKVDLKPLLNERVRHLAGYSPVAIEASVPNHETDEIDDEISQALASYRARRRELHEAGEDFTRHASLDHASRMIGEISQRIQTSPRLLRDRDIRSAFRDLVRRAEEDVISVIKRKADQESANVMADIEALFSQIERHRP
jgi:hypothetical protein